MDVHGAQGARNTRRLAGPTRPSRPERMRPPAGHQLIGQLFTAGRPAATRRPPPLSPVIAGPLRPCRRPQERRQPALSQGDNGMSLRKSRKVVIFRTSRQRHSQWQPCAGGEHNRACLPPESAPGGPSGTDVSGVGATSPRQCRDREITKQRWGAREAGGGDDAKAGSTPTDEIRDGQGEVALLPPPPSPWIRRQQTT